MLCPDMPDKSPTTATEKRLLWMVRDLVAKGCIDHTKDESTSWDGPIPVFSSHVTVDASAAEAIATACRVARLVTELAG